MTSDHEHLDTLRECIERAERRELECEGRANRARADVEAAALTYADARAECDRARAEVRHYRERRDEIERAMAWHDPNDRPDIETPAGPVRRADSVTVSADDLDHTKPNPIDRAQRRYEGTDPLAHVKPGDPDPHPENQDLDAEICWAQVDVGGLGIPDEYTCTRPENHPGQHIAGDGHEVVKVWRADA